MKRGDGRVRQEPNLSIRRRPPAARFVHRQRRRVPMPRSETWGAGPTIRFSCNIWACLRRTSVPPVRMASITRPLMTSTGSRSLAIRSSCTNRRWRGFMDWRRSAWRMRTSCRSITRSTARKSRRTSTGRRKRRRASLATGCQTFPERRRRRSILKTRAPGF